MKTPEVAQVGWDIGGAHVKVAALDPDGRVVAARQVPCPLWKGLDQLQGALWQALAALPSAAVGADQAATMTGELTDLFIDRQDGVERIVATLSHRFGAQKLRVFAGARGSRSRRKPFEHRAMSLRRTGSRRRN
jgi:uncharacterized hydantoinase/oxoprolinase family protein